MDVEKNLIFEEPHIVIRGDSDYDKLDIGLGQLLKRAPSQRNFVFDYLKRDVKEKNQS